MRWVLIGQEAGCPGLSHLWSRWTCISKGALQRKIRHMIYIKEKIVFLLHEIHFI